MSLPCGAKSLRVESFCQRFSKPIQRPRIAYLGSSKKKNPGSLGAATRGGGVAEGGPEETRLCLVHLVYCQHANPSQLFVSEIRLFLFACDFFMSEPRFARDAAQFHFRQTQQHRRAAPGYVFELLRFHGVVPHAGSRTMESSSTATIMTL